MADVALNFNPDALRALFEAEDGPVAKELQRQALGVEFAAKQLCPVDTGRLRSSIGNAVKRDAQGLVAIIGSGVEYAPYVELDQPFLRPALGTVR